LLPRRLDEVDVIGAALLGAVCGAGHRRLADRLDRPDGTVRGWLRAARRRAGWVHAQLATVGARLPDHHLGAAVPPPTQLGEAVEAAGRVASAYRRHLGTGLLPAWQLLNQLTDGRLLAPAAAAPGWSPGPAVGGHGLSRAITPTTAPSGTRPRRAGDHRASMKTNRPKTVNSNSRLVLTRDVAVLCRQPVAQHPLLRPDPDERGRLTQVLDNLQARIAEAETHRWFGEAEGLKVSLTGARSKLAEMDQISARRNTAVNLGIPRFSDVAGRTSSTNLTRSDDNQCKWWRLRFNSHKMNIF
jgi:hypothetical protein